MARIINLKTFTDSRGNLTVIEKVIPFQIKRIFYIYGVDDSIRGHHRHKETIQFAVCLQGSCTIVNKSEPGGKLDRFILNKPSIGLLIEPQDFHYMCEFSENAILMVVASEYYDYSDYIFDPYP